MEKIKKRITQLEGGTKFFLVLLAASGVYLLAFFLLTPFFTPAYSSSMAMMMQQMGFSSPSSPYLGIISLLIALIAAILLSFYLFRQAPASEKVNNEKNFSERYQLLRQGLNDEEKILLDHINEAGEITQDSLRFRLEWSKAKVSTLLTNLEKKGLVQRERTGKTYRVFLQKQQFRTV